MKKLIFSLTLLIIVSFVVFSLLKPKARQLQRVVIQTEELIPVKTVELDGTIYKSRKGRTIWVSNKNTKQVKSAKDISFYVDANALDAVLAKLNLSTTGDLYNKYMCRRKYMYGQEQKFAWLVEKQGSSTYLKLFNPSLDKMQKLNTGGC